MPLPRRVMPLQEEACPVPDHTLGHLYASPKRDVADILATLPGLQRARLAMFCHARAHLRDMALSIAATCEEADLLHVAGPLGAILYAQSREQAHQLPEHNARFRRRPISLAVLSGEIVTPLDMDEDEEMEQQVNQPAFSGPGLC